VADVAVGEHDRCTTASSSRSLGAGGSERRPVEGKSLTIEGWVEAERNCAVTGP